MIHRNDDYYGRYTFIPENHPLTEPMRRVKSYFAYSYLVQEPHISVHYIRKASRKSKQIKKDRRAVGHVTFWATERSFKEVIMEELRDICTYYGLNRQVRVLGRKPKKTKSRLLHYRVTFRKARLDTA